MKISARKPPWLKRRLPVGPEYEQTRRQISACNLHTVCQEACCPNIFECFSQRTATFLILGDRCTRDCSFCAVQKGATMPPDRDEPRRVALAAFEMGLQYVVITSVTRDDLEDGGAGQFAETINALRQAITDVLIEVLIPDFRGDRDSLWTVLNAGPDVLNHNLETVPRLYPQVRPQANYEQSLSLVEQASSLFPGIPTKSGLMLGLGETRMEINETLIDLKRSHCQILTLGQYLQPSPAHQPVERFVTPDEFEHWGKVALEMGFDKVSSAPFVRSSYHAKRAFQGLGRPF